LGRLIRTGFLLRYISDQEEAHIRVEVMQHYGLAQPLSHAGYFETTQHKEILGFEVQWNGKRVERFSNPGQNEIVKRQMAK
jgi:hypothetical protein